ncbi:DEAD/DEAH box helicase family protein [Agromyces archimandritae]|uniref:DEAD/DEAH box helicase family protein n=1 Tax=Agromyces archimandritae TaxID=2781962 RepID=A0A975FNP6_9MICO|nr:DEAD/DEAH box helicase family protein [Agromyces archimandritae]QTX05808.1 DEAD/DEAH box helicase family protein [Agromyces archimandritae]
MSNFQFFAAEWPDIAAEARRAEHYCAGDPRGALFYARRTAELAVTWMYRADGALSWPYKNDFVALIHEPGFKALVGEAVFVKLNLIRKRGNDAVHKTVRFTPDEALRIVRELWHVLVFIASRYAVDPANRPPAGIRFDAALVPKPKPGLIQKTRAELAAAQAANEEKDRELAETRAANAELLAELEALRAERTQAAERNEAEPIPHDLDEASTRSLYVDVLLREAGWDPHGTDVAEYPVTFDDGRAGRVDYVLWGDDGRPLGLVEAKRTRLDARVGQEQARRYADALEARFGQRPVIYTSNGYETWMWDDLDAPPRQVQGLRTRDELELLVQRRASRKKLASIPIDDDIAGRPYQHEAIRAVTEALEQGERRALVVMATGSGKTRTAIALVELLQQAGWVKRVLFLADRRALVRQAAAAFRAQLPDTPVATLLDGTGDAADGRIVVSTYPTMLNLIDRGTGDGEAAGRLGPGAFDLVIVDEAHRSVYRKYGAIFGYFDALLIGLTATPVDEVDRNTYHLFRLEDGVPTYAYELEKAIEQGYLMPPAATEIASEFLHRGIRYDERSAEERELWDLTDWGDDGDVPDAVDAGAFNAWLFNESTVDGVLSTLMTQGRTVAGGDRLGKTIVFARNEAHARYIQQRFDENYPEYRGTFARVITHRTEQADRLIDQFSRPDEAPHIAISVDMLDTGIDVPEVVNLVFFKSVFSKTKFWQMLGRGTRLRPDLYGPGRDKEDFAVFDVGGNIAFFNQDLGRLEPGTSASLQERLFTARVRLVEALDAGASGVDAASADLEVRQSVVEHLHRIVAGIHPRNVLARPHLRAIERFVDAAAWQPGAGPLRDALELASLPSAALAEDTDEQAKRFDALLLRAQIAVAEGGAVPDAIRDRVRALAQAMGQQRAIPLVAAQGELIEAVASPEWWQDVTVPLLELARTRLRSLVRLVPAARQKPVYADFADTIEIADAELTLRQPGVDQARFADKVRAFLAEYESTTLFKVRSGRQLTDTDLAELERILIDIGGFSADEVDAQAGLAGGLGRLIRSIVGLDGAAARSFLEDYLAASLPFNARQIGYLDLVVDHLAKDGRVDVELLYSAPFRERGSGDPEDLFGDDGADALTTALRDLDEAAAPPQLAG